MRRIQPHGILTIQYISTLVILPGIDYGKTCKPGQATHSPSSYLSRGEYGQSNDHNLQPACTVEEATSGSSIPNGEVSRDGPTTGGGRR